MCEDTQADAFRRLWLCEYESGQAFTTACLWHYQSLDNATGRQAFKAAVHDFARAHNMENKQPIRALLEALDTEPK